MESSNQSRLVSILFQVGLPPFHFFCGFVCCFDAFELRRTTQGQVRADSSSRASVLPRLQVRRARGRLALLRHADVLNSDQTAKRGISVAGTEDPKPGPLRQHRRIALPTFGLQADDRRAGPQICPVGEAQVLKHKRRSACLRPACRSPLASACVRIVASSDPTNNASAERQVLDMQPG
jgi:hypothetical protein